MINPILKSKKILVPLLAIVLIAAAVGGIKFYNHHHEASTPHPLIDQCSRQVELTSTCDSQIPDINP